MPSLKIFNKPLELPRIRNSKQCRFGNCILLCMAGTYFGLYGDTIHGAVSPRRHRMSPWSKPTSFYVRVMLHPSLVRQTVRCDLREHFVCGLSHVSFGKVCLVTVHISFDIFLVWTIFMSLCVVRKPLAQRNGFSSAGFPVSSSTWSEVCSQNWC